MRRLAMTGLIALGFLALAPNHSQAGVFRSIGIYCKDRFHDGLDIFRLRAGFPNDGKGVGVKARVTTLAQVGYVFFNGTYAGLDRRGVGVVDERRREYGISALYGSYNEMVPVYGNGFLKANSDWSEVEDRRILRNLPHWDDGRQRYLSVGAEVATPLLALDAGVYPEEVLDFALGFLTLDIYNDDELYDHDLSQMEATTLPGPKDDAPFADRQREFDALQDRIKAKQGAEALEKSGQDGITPEAVAPSDAVNDRISPQEADEAIEKIAPVTTPPAPKAEIAPEPRVDTPPEPRPVIAPDERVPPVVNPEPSGN